MAQNDQNKGGNQPPQNQPPAKAEKAEPGPVEKQFAALKAESAALQAAKARPPSDGKKRFRALKTVIVRGVSYEAGAVFDCVEDESIKRRIERNEIETAK